MRSIARAIHPMSAAAVLIVLAVCVPLSSASAQNPPGLSPIDHYKIYRVDSELFTRDPFLLDQFAMGTFQIVGPLFLGTPANKNNEGVLDPVTHYTWYEILVTSPDPVRPIVYRNQFWENGLEVRNRRYLLVPALKDPQPGQQLPPNKDHFKCYDAFGQPPNVTVTLQTQFGSEQVVVGQPELWCNPVEKRHDGQIFPIQNPQDHYVCYRIDPPNTIGQMHRVLDQFWPDPRDAFVLENRWLCVPSLESDPTPTGSTTWGRVKSQYRI